MIGNEDGVDNGGDGNGGWWVVLKWTAAPSLEKELN
jgi:hypothetical protein